MSTLICPDCNYQTDKNELFCSNCGAKLVPVCPSCGAELKPNALFCSQCGAATAKGSKNEEDISVISHPETKEASDPVHPSSSLLAVEQDNRPQYDSNTKKQAQSCKGCGKELSTEDEFCGKCGKRAKSNFWWWVAVVVGVSVGSLAVNAIADHFSKGKTVGVYN